MHLLYYNNKNVTIKVTAILVCAVIKHMYLAWFSLWNV